MWFLQSLFSSVFILQLLKYFQNYSICISKLLKFIVIVYNSSRKLLCVLVWKTYYFHLIVWNFFHSRVLRILSILSHLTSYSCSEILLYVHEIFKLTMQFFMWAQIYEIGGGSGTCAKGIMDYIKLNAPPRVYSNMSYMYVSSLPISMLFLHMLALSWQHRVIFRYCFKNLSFYYLN